MLYKELFEFDCPIPSLPLHSIKFVDNKWKFCYCFTTSKKLTDKKRKLPLYIYGGLQNLKIVDTIPKNAVNIKVYSRQDVIGLLNSQRSSDTKIRRKFRKTHKNEIDERKTITLENKSHKLNGRGYYIVEIKSIKETETVFIGRKI